MRLAPAVHGGKVYAGSDDGFLYCLGADDGRLIWKYQGGPSDRRVPGNGRVVSMWPVRCGTVVDDGKVYFTAGIFPSQGVFLCALDAETGDVAYRRKLETSAQGYMVASPSRLFIPTGRTPWVAHSRKDGQPLGKYGTTSSWGKNIVGGCFAVLVGNQIATGPSEDGQIHLFDAGTKETLVRANGRRPPGAPRCAALHQVFRQPGSLGHIPGRRKTAALARGSLPGDAAVGGRCGLRV